MTQNRCNLILFYDRPSYCKCKRTEEGVNPCARLSHLYWPCTGVCQVKLHLPACQVKLHLPAFLTLEMGADEWPYSCYRNFNFGKPWKL